MPAAAAAAAESGAGAARPAATVSVATVTAVGSGGEQDFSLARWWGWRCPGAQSLAGGQQSCYQTAVLALPAVAAGPPAPVLRFLAGGWLPGWLALSGTGCQREAGKGRCKLEWAAAGPAAPAKCQQRRSLQGKVVTLGTWPASRARQRQACLNRDCITRAGRRSHYRDAARQGPYLLRGPGWCGCTPPVPC